MIIPSTPKIEAPLPFGSMEFAHTPEGVACNSDRGSFLLPQEMPLRVVNISLGQEHLDIVKDTVAALFKNSDAHPAFFFLFIEKFAEYFNLKTRLSAWHFVSTPTHQAPKKDPPPMNITTIKFFPPVAGASPFFCYCDTNLGAFTIHGGKGKAFLFENGTLPHEFETRIFTLIANLNKFPDDSYDLVTHHIAAHFGLEVEEDGVARAKPEAVKKPSINFEQVLAIPGSRREPSWVVKTHLGDFKVGFRPTLIQNDTLNFSEVHRFGAIATAIDNMIPPTGGQLTSKQRLEVRNMIAYHFGMLPQGDTFIPFGTAYARVDAEGTAKPKSRIVHHPKADDCQGPGMALKDPEYEKEGGTRIPLNAAKPKTTIMYNGKKKVALVYSANNGKTSTGLFFSEADAIGSTLDSNGNSPAGAYVVPVEVWGTLESWKADRADKAKEAIKARALAKLTPEEREVLGHPREELQIKKPSPGVRE